MFQHKRIWMAIALVAGVCVWSQPTRVVAEDEQPLIQLLESDAAPADKALACKKLAIWGSADAVPALAALLPDPQLTSWSRIALEAIPDSAADRALREAMASLDGRPLVGVINSIGVRGDAEAVDSLVERLGDDDVDVATAAAAALGKIANEPATSALRGALADPRSDVRSAVAEGIVLCAERQLAAGDNSQAKELYDEVLAADVPKQRIVEATRGAILASGPDGVAMIVESINSGDKPLVSVALMAARELSGEGVSMKLMDALDELPASEQPRLILAMAERGDDETLPALLEVAKDGPAAQRLAALDVLAKLGDASCVPVLVGIAGSSNTGGDDADVGEAALATLAALSGDDIDAEVTARLADAEGDEQLALVRLVGMRRIDAVPALLALVHGRDPAVRSAALTALGEVARLEDVSVLIERAVNSGDDDEAAVALAALRAACVRMPNREACAQRLSDAMTDASAEAQKNMLTTLSMMGGETALQAIRSAALSNDDDMQDAATRLLGSWMSVDAGPVLLELATSPEGSYQVRALRGYLRLARQFQMTDAERAEMCRQAWRAAERDAERKLVLEVAERYPSSEMLDVVVDSCLQGPLKDDATRVIASAIEQAGGQIDAAHLVEQLAGGPVELEIVKATYGAGERQKDVTAAVAKLAGNRPLIALPPESYNDLFDGDPAPGVTKTLTIEYRLDGKTGKAEAQENSRLVLLTRQK